jgi:hypothetical protein
MNAWSRNLDPAVGAAQEHLVADEIGQVGTRHLAPDQQSVGPRQRINSAGQTADEVLRILGLLQ